MLSSFIMLHYFNTVHITIKDYNLLLRKENKGNPTSSFSSVKTRVIALKNPTERRKNDCHSEENFEVTCRRL